MTEPNTGGLTGAVCDNAATLGTARRRQRPAAIRADLREQGGRTAVWSVDCGVQANRDARGTLGPALTQQGWTSCGVGLGTMSAKKNGVMLGVQESTLAPGDYPRITQFARVISPCT